MTTDKHQAEALADLYTADHWPSHMTLHDWAKSSAAMLRRIPALEAEIEELRDDLADYRHLHTRHNALAARAMEYRDEIAILRAALDDAQAEASVAQMALEAVREDAERYRWLCTAEAEDVGICYWSFTDCEWVQDARGHAVTSAAIDAAREAQR